MHVIVLKFGILNYGTKEGPIISPVITPPFFTQNCGGARLIVCVVALTVV